MEKTDLQLIEQYFEGSLDEQGLRDFHAKMESDNSFARAVKTEKDIMDGISFLGNKQLREQLEKIGEEELKETKIKKINPVRRRFLWAAAAVLALAVVAKFAIGETKKTPEEIYAQYAVHDFDFTVKSGGGNNLGEIESLLKSEKYNEALPLLEKHIAENPNSPDVELAYGIALMELGKYGNAHLQFNKIKKDVPAMKNEIYWYEALAYLKEGDMEKCRSALEAISQNSGRHEDARKILSELEDLPSAPR